MTTTEIPSQRRSALPPLGPDSLTWHRFGDWRTALLISWSGTLQVMHPVIDTALVQHSAVFDNEVARLARSAGPIIRALYDPTGAEAQMIRDMHKDIKGTTDEGRRYHALNPGPYFWAHATFLATQYVVAEYFGEPLSPAEKEQLYQESKQWYALYGVSAGNLPETYADFVDYWNGMVGTVLEKTETVRRSRLLRGLPTPSPDDRIPAVVWRVVGPGLGRLLVWIARGTLPPAARDTLGWEWSAADERRLRRFGAVVRIGFRLLPERWRLTPIARKACEGTL
ncbi:MULTISPECIES: oxygenase MpaB family protein [unclassified Rhodococcus (in: high G+C Gram-positive bacteria)]|uniref:oxygenase MpaB family protein n=1 Tax=unclassified Rhodococcus (in: high G+C Gram-positive bacteria) TaxID=192944 RepID=UPI00163AB625|nr:MULTISPECIES: oxygenase MpaB family protein [unclassified Rhodococcus (in: high G+C Gram-positive bacteria)]MBC2640191.1 DUF2236 domain-containing protein [Rhodococcus sp. 3A]MBC2895062.1 DUF2236 domain-containing protein [Rhodococcus sp. 4CII]